MLRSFSVTGSRVRAQGLWRLCSPGLAGSRHGHLLGRSSRPLRLRYYLHRWRSMNRARARIKALTARSQVGHQLPDVIGRLKPVASGMGQLLPHRKCGIQVRLARPLRCVAAQALARQEARPQPSCRSGRPLDPHLVPRPGSAQAHGHHPIPEGCVIMSRRSSVSCVRENRTDGLKGGWGTGPALRAPRP